MNKIITLTGCSACGKDTILNALLRIHPNLKKIVSYTNRPIRDGEIQDVSYHFTTYEDMKNKIRNNDFIDHRAYDVISKDGLGIEEWIYGISVEEILKDGIKIVILDLNGAINIQRYCYQQDIKCISYYIDCESRIRLDRSLKRQPNASKAQVEEMCRRLLDDEMKISPNKERSFFDMLLKNNTKNDFINCVMTISKEIERKN